MNNPKPDLYRDLAEFAPDALLVVDGRGVIAYANAHAHTLFGYEPGELNGAPLDTLIPPESRPTHTAHREAYARDPRLREMGNRGMPLFGLRKNGTRFRAEIRLAPIRTSEGMVSAAAVRDATESERIMEMLANARQTAEEANEAKNRLLAAASHDLRQPLQSLRLLNGALKRLSHDAAVLDVLDQEERALKTMSDLLHALLNIAKLESGAVRPTLADVPLAPLFEDLRRQFSGLAKLKGLELAIDAAHVQVRTDPVLLAELLQNLVANAMRYTDRGRVSLTCRVHEPGLALIEVADTGIGIPEALRERIFEDFFQVAARQEAHRGGAGLGLGIVRRLAQVLGLAIRVDSEVGVGTRFTIEMPALEVSAAAAAPPKASALSVRRERILLVEDDRAMREALKTYLTLDEHEVHAVSSLAELDETLDRLTAPPTLVISDFHLGAMERGSDAIDRIRLRYQRPVPAILLTGDTSAIPARFTTTARLRLLNKPVDGERLVATMQELVSAGD